MAKTQQEYWTEHLEDIKRLLEATVDETEKQELLEEIAETEAKLKAIANGTYEPAGHVWETGGLQ